MEKEGHLPFKVGQLAEARSFEPGYRGAWFRCKIRKVSRRKGSIGHVLEYFDFPDEKISWTRLYEMPPKNGQNSKGIKALLMVRPQYPPIYHESQVPHVSKILEPIVVFSGVCKVGDLVDWWTDDCYWCGRVTKILGDDKVQIELLPPPAGEGASYEALCKDLRPSLDWSPDYGWTLSTSMEGDECLCLPCARIIQPLEEAEGLTSAVTHGMDKEKDAMFTDEWSHKKSVASHFSVATPNKSDPSGSTELFKQPVGPAVLEEMRTLECTSESYRGDSETAKASCADHVCSSCLGGHSVETAGQIDAGDLNYSEGSLKMFRLGGGILLNSMQSDTLEAAILDLEELVNKVKWLQGILDFGIPVSDALRPPSWKFVEQCAPSMPK